MVPDNMDALEWLPKHLEAEGSDLLREMVRTFAERLMSAEVEVLCNVGYAEVTPERTNSRNDYRSRQLDTRVGSVDLSIPKLREGSYFPGWLLEPRPHLAAGFLPRLWGRPSEPRRTRPR